LKFGIIQEQLRNNVNGFGLMVKLRVKSVDGTKMVNYLIKEQEKEMFWMVKKKRWHENGQLSYLWVWKNQLIVGEEKGWYSSGKPNYIRFLDENMKNIGEEKRWFENGNLSLIKGWKNGFEHGVEKRFHEDGSLKEEFYWENGKRKD